MIKNATAEKDLREWLSNNGWRGSSAKFDEIELHAIKAPGWVQLFRFSASVKNQDGQIKKIHGSLLDDDRYNKLDIQIFENLNEQRNNLSILSKDLITAKRVDAVDITLALKAAAVFVVVVLALVALSTLLIS